jgi:hypothetical protein
MHLSGLDLLFWAGGFVGHIVLLFVLLRRGRAAKFPAFSILIGASIARTVGLYAVLHIGTAHQYFLTYWILALVDAALQFAVVYGIAARIFRPLGSWARDVKSSLAALIFVSLLIAAGLTWLASPPTQFWLQTVVIKWNFFSSACMSELFVGMLALSVTAGLPWKTHVSRIALGLGLYSMFAVLIETSHNYFGVEGNDHLYILLSHVRMLVYLGCLCFWALTLWPDEPAPRPLTDAMRAQLSEFQQRLQDDLRRVRSARWL